MIGRVDLHGWMTAEEWGWGVTWIPFRLNMLPWGKPCTARCFWNILSQNASKLAPFQTRTKLAPQEAHMTRRNLKATVVPNPKAQA